MTCCMFVLFRVCDECVLANALPRAKFVLHMSLLVVLAENRFLVVAEVSAFMTQWLCSETRFGDTTFKGVACHVTLALRYSVLPFHCCCFLSLPLAVVLSFHPSFFLSFCRCLFPSIFISLWFSVILSFLLAFGELWFLNAHRSHQRHVFLALAPLHRHSGPMSPSSCG